MLVAGISFELGFLEAVPGPAPSSGGGRGPCEGEEARVVQQRTMDNEA